MRKPERRASASDGDGILKQTFEELRLSGSLPSPSGIGMRILTLTAREDYSTLEIAHAIEADPALTGRLLKLANSAQAASVEPITTVKEATMRLGVRAVRNVALGLSLVSANREGRCDGFDYDRYWADSLARAVAAQAISVQSAIGVPAEAYVCGLLSNVGSLAFASVYPEEYSQVLHEAVSSSSDLARCERNRFAITHAEVAAYMLEDWGLPEVHREAVRTYEEEPGEPDSSSGWRPLITLTDVLRAARTIADICTASLDAEASRWTRFHEGLEALRQRLGLEPASFYAFCNGIVAQWREWGTILTIPTPTAVDFEDIPRRAGSHASPDEAVDPVTGAGRTTAPPAPPREPMQLETAPGVGLRILAVDDDDLQLRILERYLARLGARVTVARDGRQALQLALADTPQIVIADWMMPGMDGVELCRALRRIKLGREMYFVVLTGREEEQQVLEAFDAGVDDYVVKPFNPKILLARIKAGKRVIELENERAKDQGRLLKQAKDISLLNRRLRALALTDLLTELRNRRFAIERLQQEWANCNRSGKPLSVIMVDIDHFKRINDTYGHDGGDVVLRETARVLRREVRQGDDAIRMGGEEFLIICYGTRAEQAAVCAERVRAAVEANAIAVGKGESRVTISLGIAERTSAMADVDALLKAADEMVYAAKAAGRNQTFIHDAAEGRRKSA